MVNKNRIDFGVKGYAGGPRIPGYRPTLSRLPSIVKNPRPEPVSHPKEWVTPKPSKPTSGYPSRKAAMAFSDPRFPETRFEIMNPSWEIDVDYPIEDFLGRSYSAELLKAVATESGGSATATLTATAGFASEIHALEITMQQSTFQTPQGGGRLTVTFAGLARNAHSIQDSYSDGVATAVCTSQTETEVFDWSSPADGLQRRFYVLIGRRIAGLGKTVPEVAVVRTPIVVATTVEVAQTTVQCAFTNLASGSGIQFVVQACTPGTLPYERLLGILPSWFGQEY